MNPAARARAVVGALVALALARAVAAQLSPGPLATPHERLEGNARCLECHRQGKGVDPVLCLDCHRALADRVGARQGLHAGADYRACERCHSEHNGRDFELVRFPGGEAAFDHAATGWKLGGAHVRVRCRDCHRPERVAPAVGAREPGLDARRTFLGLPTACAACHADPHGGTLAASCAACHTEETWKGAPGFDHGKTRYPLDGAHARVACRDCHRPQDPGAKAIVFAQFAARALPRCADCHKDPHAGRLGADCSSCHSTASFRGANGPAQRFDHERTAYPLRGEHRKVGCEKCHTPGRELRVAGFERCETCHRDAHWGQLANVAGKAGCAACHGVDGFRPALFVAADHARGRFALSGAHRAVACVACHGEVAGERLPSPFRHPGAGVTRQYRFAAVGCRDCHADPHRGTLDRYVGEASCAGCHDEDDWRRVRFDHGKSRYPLAGRHATVACVECHPRAAGDEPRVFAGRPLDCAGCHRDRHAGQFAVAAATACERCHDVEGFAPARRFDHQRDARYALDGRHAAVPCAGCHPSATAGGETVVRYRPRPMDCEGCHGPATAKRGAA